MWDLNAIQKMGYTAVSDKCKVYTGDHCGKAGEKRVRICCANSVLCVDCVRSSFDGSLFFPRSLSFSFRFHKIVSPPPPNIRQHIERKVLFYLPHEMWKKAAIP